MIPPPARALLLVNDKGCHFYMLSWSYLYQSLSPNVCVTLLVFLNAWHCKAHPLQGRPTLHRVLQFVLVTISHLCVEKLCAEFCRRSCSLHRIYVQKKMTFDFKRINIKLGPWKFGFNLKAGQFGTK